jgi:hypothetical protein
LSEEKQHRDSIWIQGKKEGGGRNMGRVREGHWEEIDSGRVLM